MNGVWARQLQEGLRWELQSWGRGLIRLRITVEDVLPTQRVTRVIQMNMTPEESTQLAEYLVRAAAPE